MQRSIQEQLTKQPTGEPVVLLKVNQSDFISMWLAAKVVKNLDRRPPPSWGRGLILILILILIPWALFVSWFFRTSAFLGRLDGAAWGNRMICQSNRGNNLKMPKMPKSVQCRGQFVTALCRVVSAFVTGSPMLNPLTINICDGVTAPDPWTPRPRGWYGGCPNLLILISVGPHSVTIHSTCFELFRPVSTKK